MSAYGRMQIDPYLSPCTKLKSKWIKDLSINPVTAYLIEEKGESCLELIVTGDSFLDITPVAQLILKIHKWDLLKLKSFCKAKEIVSKAK